MPPDQIREEGTMESSHRVVIRTVILLAAGTLAAPALSQKQGGTLLVLHRDSPPSMSIHEEATISTSMPMMGVFNNLVMFDPKEKQNKLSNIVPDLAESWSWSADKTKLIFKLRQGVKWHDGKPFTAKDVQCTWNKLMGKDLDDFRKNPRASWYTNLDDVTVNGDDEATFRLKRSQPSFIALLASGFSPVYPCHVSARDMRSHPIGTGPFKFVEFKPNESIKVARNPDYWKKDRPYLAGKVDLTSPYYLQVPVVNDIRNQAPEAICNLVPVNVNRNVIMNREVPPFNDADLRRAV